MPDTRDPVQQLLDIVHTDGRYPLDAFLFVQHGLQYTADRMHGEWKLDVAPEIRHVSGQQLCEGLRDLANEQWGAMADAVLRIWRVQETFDFGRIVYALIDGGVLHRQPSDSIEDFRNVFDFRHAFAPRITSPLPVS